MKKRSRRFREGLALMRIAYGVHIWLIHRGNLIFYSTGFPASKLEIAYTIPLHDTYTKLGAEKIPTEGLKEAAYYLWRGKMPNGQKAREAAAAYARAVLNLKFMKNRAAKRPTTAERRMLRRLAGYGLGGCKLW